MLAAMSGRKFALACMFTVFVNIFIINLRVLSAGCNVNGFYICCLIYADNLILMPATVNGLPAMFNCCFSIAQSYACNLTVQSPYVRLQALVRRIGFLICSWVPALFRSHQLLNTWVSLSLVVKNCRLIY